MSEAGSHNLTCRQAMQLADHFMFYLQPDERQRLMRELPAAYNAYYGREVVSVKVQESPPDK